MAPKQQQQQRPSPLDNPPNASSSDEYESGSDESESTQPEPIATKPLPQSSASVTDSDSDEEEAETVAPVKPKPTPPPKSKSKPAAKPAASASAAAPAKSATKRAAVSFESNAKDAKKAKKQETTVTVFENDAKKAKNESNEGESNKSSSKQFMRIWTEEDELVILKGMINYAKKKGASPQSDMTAFQEFIQNSLSAEHSKTQFHDKIRRLKKKYETNLSRKNKPSKPHDLSIFELSHKVWGGERENGVVAKSKTPKAEPPPVPASLNANSKKPMKSECSGSTLGEVVFGLDKGYAGLGFSETIMKEGLDLVDAAKRGVLEDKWKQVHVDEMELFAMKLDLMREETRLIMEARAKSD